MNNAFDECGHTINKDMNKIVVHDVTKCGEDGKTVSFVIDMRNNYANKGGVCLLKDSIDKLSD